MYYLFEGRICHICNNPDNPAQALLLVPPAPVRQFLRGRRFDQTVTMQMTVAWCGRGTVQLLIVWPLQNSTVNFDNACQKFAIIRSYFCSHLIYCPSNFLFSKTISFCVVLNRPISFYVVSNSMGLGIDYNIDGRMEEGGVKIHSWCPLQGQVKLCDVAPD